MAASLLEITAIMRALFRDSDVELAPTTRFDDVLGCDSMDLVNAVVEIEARFDVQFDLVEIDRLVTIDDLLRLIVAKQALAAA